MKTLSSIILLLLFFATLEQLKLISFPGQSWVFGILVRPASLTGSYLHYPLVMVLLSVALFSLSKKLNIVLILGFSSVFFAFSRSGMMLVFLVFIMIYASFFIKKLRNKIFYFKRKSILFLTALVLISSLSVFVFYDDYFSLVFERVISSFDTSGSGNSARLQRWTFAVNEIFSTNVFFGENFGKITNMTGNLTGSSSDIVESGFFQCVLNFGLIGTIFFYLMFFSFRKKNHNLIYKSFVISFVIQTFVYQSIEVLPFITGIFVFGGIVSDCDDGSLYVI